MSLGPLSFNYYSVPFHSASTYLFLLNSSSIHVRPLFVLFNLRGSSEDRENAMVLLLISLQIRIHVEAWGGLGMKREIPDSQSPALLVAAQDSSDL